MDSSSDRLTASMEESNQDGPPTLQIQLPTPESQLPEMYDDPVSYLPDEHPAKDETSPLLDSDDQEPRTRRSYAHRLPKWRIWKNLLSLSVAYLFVFTSYASLQNLESSLDLSSGLGVTTLACVFAGMFLSSLYAPLFLRLFGTKWVMLLLFVAQALFAAAHYNASFYTLIPAAVLVGLVSSPASAAESVYIVNMARQYASATETEDEIVIMWFNGIYLAFFQMTQITGNLISSSILQASKNSTSSHGNHTDWGWETCGAGFCSGDNVTNSENFQHPSDHVVNVMVSVFVACCVTGIIVMLLVMDRCRDLERSAAGSRSLLEDMMGTVLAHLHDPWLSCLIPLFLWTGVEQAFLYSEYTEAFVSCQVGLSHVGYAMMGFGAGDAIGSILVGRLERYTGRPSLMMSAAVINFTFLLVMLLWKPHDGPDALLYVIPVFWGLGDAIWQTITTALIGTEFPGMQESAFSMFRMWQAAGFTFLFAISQFLCMDVKIYITLSLLVLTVSLYLVAEVGIRHNKSRPWLDLHAPIA